LICLSSLGRLCVKCAARVAALHARGKNHEIETRISIVVRSRRHVAWIRPPSNTFNKCTCATCVWVKSAFCCRHVIFTVRQNRFRRCCSGVEWCDTNETRIAALRSNVSDNALANTMCCRTSPCFFVVNRSEYLRLRQQAFGTASKRIF